MVRNLTRFLLIALLAAVSITTTTAQSTDTKDVQIARKKLRVGLDTSKYVTSTTDTITAASTHRQLPTAKAVYQYGLTLDSVGGGGGSGGHLILDDNTTMTQRAGLNFVSTPTIVFTGTDDLANDETEISAIVPNDGIGANQIATGAVGTAEIADASVALADMANMATSSLIYRKTAGSGAPEVNTLATLKTDLGLTGTNSGDQIITLTGDVTGSGTGSFAATIAANAVGSAEITDGSIVAADLNQMSAASGEVLKWNGSAWAPATDVSSGGAANYQTIRDDNSNMTQQPNANFVSTATVTATLTDDAANTETEIAFSIPTDGVTATEIAAGAVGTAEIANASVALADMADMATASLIYRKTAGSGAPEVNTLATLKTDLGLTGTNSGDQTITLTGDVTGSGTGSFATTIASNAIGSAEITNGTVALADMANMATSSLIYRKTAGSGAPEVNTLATLKTDLGLTGTNSGDQTITLTGDVTGSGTGSFAATIADNSVDGTDIALGSDAQGDVMYYDGTNWVRLPAGTSGQFLKTNGAAANPSWATSSGGHELKDEGVALAQQPGMNFLQSANINITLNNDAAGSETEVTAAIISNSITDFEIAAGAVGTSEIADASIIAADLDQMGAASGEVLKWNGTAWAPATDISSGGSANYQTLRDDNTDLTQRANANFVSSATVTATLTDDLANTETEISFSIPSNGITATEIASDAVGSSEIATDAVGSAEIATDAVGAAEIVAGAVGTTEIADASVALADMADMATSSLIYRKTAGSGAPEVNTLATLKTDLGLTGTNSGDQTITLTGDVTGSGTGSFAATIAADAVGAAEIVAGGVGTSEIADASVALADMANIATSSLIYRKTAGTGAPEVNTLATLKTDLGLTGTNSGDQTITLTGDVTGSGTGSFATNIAANAVGAAEIADASVGAAELAVGAVDLASTDVTGINTVAKGGTGVGTLTGYVKGNGISAMTAAATVPETDIASGTLLARVADSETISGAWLFNNTGNRFNDDAFVIQDNLDNTKKAAFQASGISALTTQTYTLPNSTGTFALTNDAAGGDATGILSNLTIADNSVDGTDIALGSDAQGDVMYYDGTNWTRLAAGTAGRFLKTNGAAANPAWADEADGSTSNELQDLAVSTLTDSTFRVQISTYLTGVTLKEGSNIAITRAADVLTISSTGGGGGGYATVAEEGTDLTARTKLNFVGTSATAADDAGNSRTNVTFDSDLDALASTSTTGMYAVTGTGTSAPRTITGTGNLITVTNGNGVSGNPTITVGSDVVTLTGTQVITNKEITKRVGTMVSGANITASSASHDFYTVTALAQAADFSDLGTGDDGQGMIYRVKDNGTARALTFHTSFRFSAEIPAPTTTTVSSTLYLAFIYNAADGKWDCVSKINGF